MAEVTLFIEDTAIRLLVAKGRRVERWATLPLEPGLVSDGVILDEAQVASRLKELFRLQGVGVRTVTAGLSGFNSIYRLVSLPELPPAILPEAVKQEASRVIPTPIDQVYLSYQSIPAPAGETRVFMAAFPRNTTDALLRTLNKAGLKASTMDLAPLALCRTVDVPQAIVVDVRSASLDIVVMVDRVPQVIRGLSLPSEAKSLSERLPSIAEELNRTIAFYNSSHQEKPLDSTVPIFVSGDLAVEPDIWQSLVGTSGYSVSALPSPMQSLEGFDPSQFMVNIGLALKKLSLEKEGALFSLVNFNTMPEAEKPKGISLSKILMPVGIVIGAGLVFWMVTLVQNSMAHTETLRSQLLPIESRITEQRQEIVAVMEEIKLIEPQVEPLEATASIFETTFTSLGEERDQVDGDLSRIVGLLPESVNLTDINHSVAQVIVSGIAPDEDGIFEYARNLRSSGRFSMVVISSIDTSIEAEGEEEEEEEITGFSFEFLLITNIGE